ncbi:Uncharacterised protein [Chlamydia trachomatis]|nr:Uncharacterised protein [Chlamydia trachomatis]
MLNIRTSRNIRPARQPQASRFHGLPNIHKRVTNNQHTARPTRLNTLGNPRLFRPLHKVIDQNTGANFIRRSENFQDLFKMIHALKQLDNYSHFCQIIAPHVLDELRIVATLNPDPRLLRYLRNPLRPSNRTRVRHRTPTVGSQLRLECGHVRFLGTRRRKHNGTTLQPETATEWEGPD